MSERRWPPTYDFETLVEQIEKISRSDAFVEGFYTKLQPSQPCFCQGDVVSFKSDFPVIDADGDIATIDNSDQLWIFVGNTCDFTRHINLIKFSHISPLEKLDDTTPEDILANLKLYKTYKRFYLPEWESGTNNNGYALDFSKLCSVDKDALNTHAKVLARLSQESWYLFHSRLVRFLARDDGRDDSR